MIVAKWGGADGGGLVVGTRGRCVLDGQSC
jgi:hypothetical protein